MTSLELDYFGRKIQGVRRWTDVCQPKDLGGLGATSIIVKNISLLCKWIWKLENEDGLWQKVIRTN
jgi:hypothetical protein